MRAKEKAKNNQANRKKLEAEISPIEAKISKYRDQMMAVKTNEEYRALQHEIEHAQTAIRKVEDEILNLMMEAETVQADIKTAEAQLKEDQQKVKSRGSSSGRREQARPQRARILLEGAQGNRGDRFGGSRFAIRRVRKHRGGIGVAPARNEVCEICQVRIRPQVYQEIRKNDQIIACDACQRILYNPENLDHPFEVA